jgi:2-dehydro-3-deoxygalactonokinase
VTHSPACAVFLDVGTTNARAWLVHGTQILARASAPVGVRDAARDGSNEKLCHALKELIAAVIAQSAASQPTVVIGAGMISSPLGLAEVPHVSAPAGLAELASGVQTFSFPDITPLPIKLVPGIRTGPEKKIHHGGTAFGSEAQARREDTEKTKTSNQTQSDADSGPLKKIAQPSLSSSGFLRDLRASVVNQEFSTIDLMRGEETLCLGLLSLGKLNPPATVLNLGSHWKAIQIGADQRITGSITSLSGEMIHAIQSATILASAVPQTKPADLDDSWIANGMAQQRATGLPRAMFCVRLLEQTHQATPAQRMAFLIGAFIAADLDALFKNNAIRSNQPVVLVGPAPLAHAWKTALTQSDIQAKVTGESDIEAATIAGLNQILRH